MHHKNPLKERELTLMGLREGYTPFYYILWYITFSNITFSSSLNTPYYTHSTILSYILLHHFAHLSNTLCPKRLQNIHLIFSIFKFKNIAQSTQFIKISPFRIQILSKYLFHMTYVKKNRF